MERLAKNDSHILQNGRHVEVKGGGLLNVKGMEYEIENNLSDMHLGKIQANRGKLNKIMEKFIAL